MGNQSHYPSILFAFAMSLLASPWTDAIPNPKSSSVEMIQGRPMIVIDGEPHYPMIYALTDVPSGRWSWEELPQHNIKNFCRSGVHLFQLDVHLEHIWTKENGWDLTIPRKQIAGVLEVCPDAAIIFRFHLRAPRWWLRQHPEEWVKYADTDYQEEQAYALLRIIEHDNGPVRRVSMASKKWKAEMSEKFVKVLETFSQTPEANALIGIQVANGVYGEWHNWGFFANEPDVSEPMTQAFQEWLKNKYKSEKAMQDAWNQPEITFSNVTAPGMEKRATESVIRDLETEREVIDYVECMHQVVADNIIHFAGLVKAHWPRPIITGTFYGYYFSVFGRQAPGGHLQLRRILESDAIDYLSGPQAYGPEATELGNPYRSRSLITSVRLNNKLWLDEMDVEPKLPVMKYGPDHYEQAVQRSVADVRRNVSFSFTKGMGLWFYDFNVAGVDLDGYRPKHAGSQGTWDQPVVMRQIERMHQLFRKRALETPYRTEADVLFVYDTDSFYYTASLKDSDPVSHTLIDHNSLAAFRSGVIFDPIHLDDLPKVDLDQYRVVVFNNTYLMNQEERTFIKDRVAAKGRSIIWFYAPGFIAEDQRKSGKALVEDLTGFRLDELSTNKAPEISLAAAGLADETYQVGESPFHPLFAVNDSDARALGHFTEGNGVAIASKSMDDHQAWFVSLPSKQTKPIQLLLKAAGGHIYGEPDAFFYGGNGVLVMHTLTGGPREIHLRNGDTLNLDLPEGPNTVFLDADTGSILMNEYDPELDQVYIQHEE